MKKFNPFIRPGFAIAGFALCVGLLFSACKKDNSTNDYQVSALMAFNLIADKPGINITLSNNGLTASPLQYSEYTVSYLNIYPGNRTIQAYNSSNADTSLTNSNYIFDVKKYYSLFVVGANNVYSNVVALDNYDSLSASNGNAYIRYVNAIPDSSNPQVTISAGGTNVSSVNAHFTTVSQFIGVTPGQVAINVSNDANIQASRTITVEAQKVYTILLIGKPGDADPANAVQIKYIQNGRLTQ